MFNLNECERILGVTSSQRDFNFALHYDFTLIIGKEISKYVILKLFVNRNSKNDKTFISYVFK